MVEIYTKNRNIITQEMINKNKKLREAMKQADFYLQSEGTDTEKPEPLQKRRTSFSDNNLTIDTQTSPLKRKAQVADSPNNRKKKKVIEDLTDEDDSDFEDESNNDHSEEEEYSFSDEEEKEQQTKQRKSRKNKFEEEKSTCYSCGKNYKITLKCANDICAKVFCKKCCGNPTLAKKYFEDWLCPDCKICEICENIKCEDTDGDESTRRLYTCTKCDQGFHLNCLAGEGEFFFHKKSLLCPGCTENKREWSKRRGENDNYFNNHLFVMNKNHVMEPFMDSDIVIVSENSEHGSSKTQSPPSPPMESKRSPKSGKAVKQKPCANDTPKSSHSDASNLLSYFEDDFENPYTPSKSKKATKVKHGVKNENSVESSGNVPGSAQSSPKDSNGSSRSPTSPTSSPTQDLNEITIFIKCSVDGSESYTKRVKIPSRASPKYIKDITNSIMLKMKKPTLVDKHDVFLKNVDRFGHEVLLSLDDEFFEKDKLQQSDVLVIKM